MVEVLGEAFEQELIGEINKIRAGKKLSPIALFPGYHALAEARVKLIAEEKAPVKTEGFKERADKIIGEGRAQYLEAVGRSPLDADVQKGGAALIQELVEAHKAKVEDAGLSEVGIVVAKKERMYSFLAGFIFKTAGDVPKGNRSDAKLSTPAEDQQILEALNKLRVAKGLPALTLVDGYHAVADEHVLSIVTGEKKLSTENFKDRSQVIFGKGFKNYKEGVGWRTGSGGFDVAAEAIVKQQGKNAEDGEYGATAVGISVANLGETWVWLLGFAK